MRIIFGDQKDEYDFHKVGFIESFLVGFLVKANYSNIRRVKDFELFDDTSKLTKGGIPISLNMIAVK